MTTTINDLHARAASLRSHALTIAAGRGQGYIGQALGTADILAALLFGAWHFDGEAPERDRFVLSPGHYAPGLYAALAEQDRMPLEILRTYGMDGSDVQESPLEGLTGFEITGGSLGQGLSQALGLALGKKLQGHGGHVFCLISDGELQEGQTWEALLAASRRQPPNLTVVLDRNGRQVDGPTETIVPLDPVEDKLEAFGLAARRVDGHDRSGFRGAGLGGGAPGTAVVVCDTELGHRVPVMRDAHYPHYVRADADTWRLAAEQLADGGAQ